MKLTDKRFWKFEATMLLCGVATVCIEALSYGISLFYLIGQLLIYPLCFFIGGVATWKVSKAGKVWRLIGYSMLFSFITYNLFAITLYPIFGIPFASSAYLSSVGCFALFSVLPVVICCYAYRWMEK